MRSTASIGQRLESEMSTFDRLLRSLGNLWAGELDSRFNGRPLPPIRYPKVNIVQRPPRDHEIDAGAVTIVAPVRHPKWAMFLCPCGCQTVITLSLQTAKRPHWIFTKSRTSRPTLEPSIWRDIGCFSHFFLQDGRVYWCNDTGVSPDEVRRSRNLRRADSKAE